MNFKKEVFHMIKVQKKKSDTNELVSIIILNYNGGKIIVDCLASVFKTKNCAYEVILIDNNSTDNSHIICKKKFPMIKLVENNKNLGIGARTIGLEKAKGEFTVFLDSDTKVDPNWLVNLLKSYKDNGSGLYQAKLLDMNDHCVINTAGNMTNVFGLGFSRGKGEIDVGQYDRLQIICFPAGACTFSSTKIMRKIGGVDYVFFMYHDDMDYGWRAWLQGIPSYYEPKAIVYHLGSSTFKWTSKKFFYLERNRWICLLTLYSKRTLAKIFPLLVIIEVGIFFYFLSKGLGLTKIKSYFSLRKIRNEIKNKEKTVGKTRKLSDKEVIKNFVDDFYLPPNLAGGFSAKLIRIIIPNLSKIARKLI